MPIRKPEQCKGCPFYSLSEYITPDRIVPGAEVLILAQNPGVNEETGERLLRKHYKDEITEHTTPQPLIGATGKWLQEEFWPLTGIEYAKVSRANVIKCRPNNANELPSIASNKSQNSITVVMLKEAIAHCTAAYLHVPEPVRYVLAMGSISLYALTGQKSITEWRGWCVGSEGVNSGQYYGLDNYYSPSSFTPLNIFPVVHIAALFQSQTLYHATQLDFRRFGRLVRGEWPVVLPGITVNSPPMVIPSYIGFDTEYDIFEGNRLIMWSLADVQGNIYVTDAGVMPKAAVQPGTTVVTQNGLVDLPHFRDLFDMTSITLEDCMIAHALLWPGEPANLDYMTSKYSRYNRHKHLRTSSDKDINYLYAGLDADTTLNSVWRALLAEFKRDGLSYAEYRKRRQPLLHIIDRFNARGVQVYQERVQQIGAILDAQMTDIAARAQVLTGDPTFNIASHQQVGDVIYGRDTAVRAATQPRQSGRYHRGDRRHLRGDGTRAVNGEASQGIDAKVAALITQLKLELGEA